MIQEDLLRALEEEFEEITPFALKRESNLKELIDWNSLNTLVVAARIKQDYGVKLMPNDFKDLVTFNDLIMLVNNKVKQF